MLCCWAEKKGARNELLFIFSVLKLGIFEVLLSKARILILTVLLLPARKLVILQTDHLSLFCRVH